MTTFLKFKLNNKNNEKNKIKAIDNFFKNKEDFFKDLYNWNKDKLDGELENTELKELKMHCIKGNSTNEYIVRICLITNRKIDICDTVKIFNHIYGDIFKQIQDENAMDIETLTFNA